VFSRRAGVFAAAAIALVPMFVFYAKTANPEVAYVFWFALSLAFYLRALDTLALRDVVVCFAAAAMAICTKDQAYALFISMPVVLMFRLRAVADRRLWIGGAAAALLFIAVQNIPLNAHGFISHVRDITGPGRNYAMFEPTFGGQLRLAELTLDIDVRSWGWPLFLASAAGFLIAIAGETTRAAAIRLGLVAATYYVAFIALIRYDYDRYLLPIAVVQALFAGLAIDRLLGGAATRQWRIVAAAAVFAYSTLYAATVDALMVNDSRYEAERWLADHAGRDRVVGHVFPLVVLPRMDDFNHADVSSLEYLHRIEPEFFVVNADYARALTTDRPDAAVLAGLRDGTLGYRLAYRHRTPSPWPWLPGAHPDLVGPRDEGPIVSFLRDINPTIEIYERRQP
jgi:hypothetical protein